MQHHGFDISTLRRFHHVQRIGEGHQTGPKVGCKRRRIGHSNRAVAVLTGVKTSLQIEPFQFVKPTKTLPRNR